MIRLILLALCMVQAQLAECDDRHEARDKLEAQVAALRNVLQEWWKPTGSGLTVMDAERLAGAALKDTETVASAFVAKIRADAYEACAKIAETYDTTFFAADDVVQQIAATIRAAGGST